MTWALKSTAYISLFSCDCHLVFLYLVNVTCYYQINRFFPFRSLPRNISFPGELVEKLVEFRFSDSISQKLLQPTDGSFNVTTDSQF